MIFNRTNDKDHPLLQEPRVNIEGALPPRSLLDHHRHQAEGLWVQIET